jgi:hypothetical protein
VVKTTKHPSEVSYSQQNEAEEATEEEDVAATRSEKKTTMRQKIRRESRYERSERSSVCGGRAFGQAGRQAGGGDLVPRAAEEQEQESTAATHLFLLLLPMHLSLFPSPYCLSLIRNAN